MNASRHDQKPEAYEEQFYRSNIVCLGDALHVSDLYVCSSLGMFTWFRNKNTWTFMFALTCVRHTRRQGKSRRHHDEHAYMHAIMFENTRSNHACYHA
jgi:hypothetical protein